MDHIVQVFVFGEGGLIWIYVTVHVSGVAICIFILLLTSAMKISGMARGGSFGTSANPHLIWFLTDESKFPFESVNNTGSCCLLH